MYTLSCSRLNEVLEMAEDYSIDIPKFWDYLGEVLAPVMAHSTLNLSLLSGVPPSLVSSILFVYLHLCIQSLGVGGVWHGS